MSVFKTLLAFLLSALLVACSSPDNSEPPAELTEIENPLVLNIDWSIDTGEGIHLTSFNMSPLLISDMIYSIDTLGIIQQIDPVSGRRQWSFESGLKSISGLAGNTEILIASSREGEIIAYNLPPRNAQSNGRKIKGGLKKRWQKLVHSEIRATPLIDGDDLYVRTVNGKLIKLSLNTGKTLWSVNRRVPALSLTGNSRPLVFEDMVISGFDNGKISAFLRENGQTEWEGVVARPKGRTEIERLVDIDGQFILRDGIIYASSFQGKLVAIQAHSGNILWSRNFSSHQSMIADQQALYLTDERSHLWSIDRRTGSALWKQEVLNARKTTAPQMVGDQLVVADLEGYVHFFDKQDGKLIGRIEASYSRHISQPLVYKNKVLVQDSTGVLSAISSKP